MPERTGNDEVKAVQLGVLQLFGKVNIGAAGAITSQDTPAFNVVRNSAGNYTITFTEKYPELLGLQCVHFQQSTPVGLVMEIDADYSASAGTVTIVLVEPSTNAETDPANGDSLRLVATVKTTNVGP